jgi:hypothetical protein
MVSKRKILSPRRESNPDHPIVQPVASRYTISAQREIKKSGKTGWKLLQYRPTGTIITDRPYKRWNDQFGLDEFETGIGQQTSTMKLMTEK